MRNSISDGYRAIACQASASIMMSFINMGSAMIAVIIMGYLPYNSLENFILMLVCFTLLVVFGLKYVYSKS